VDRFKSVFRDRKKSKTEKTKTKEELQELAAKALPQISRSEDHVSKRLVPLFDRAVEANSPETERAKARQELGNPPGKPRGPLGDQITWEQLLTYCEKQNVERLWIVTSDGDYLTKFGERVWLNPFLHQELKQACGDGLEVRCFDNSMTAIEDFVKSTGVKAEKLPNEERAKEIKVGLQAWLMIRTTGALDAPFKAMDDGELGQTTVKGGPSLSLLSSLQKPPQ
jgi:hypothetical protein